MKILSNNRGFKPKVSNQEIADYYETHEKDYTSTKEVCRCLNVNHTRVIKVRKLLYGR